MKKILLVLLIPICIIAAYFINFYTPIKSIEVENVKKESVYTIENKKDIKKLVSLFPNKDEGDASSTLDSYIEYRLYLRKTASEEINEVIILYEDSDTYFRSDFNAENPHIGTCKNKEQAIQILESHS